MALGLKGGFALAHAGLGGEVLPSLLRAVALAFAVPAIGYAVLRRFLSGFDAAAIADFRKRFWTALALTIPVLIFAGWFGMNFSNMHELEWKYGYAGAAALVLVSTIAMLRFMRKRKWL